MPHESRSLSNPLIKALRAQGHFVWKQHGGMFGRAGLPDIVGFVGAGNGTASGMGIAIETKIKGNKPTKLQAVTLRDIERTSAIAGVAYTVAEGLGIVADGIRRIAAERDPQSF